MARRHHYGFAHQVLRDMLFLDPMRFFATFDSPRGTEIALRVWREFGARFPPDDRVEGTGLTCTKRELTSGLWCPALVFTLPPAQEITEAIFAAAVLAGEPRYYTLERTMAFPPATSATVLCSWSQGTHLNHGIGTEETIEAFLAAVEKLVNE